MLVQRWRHHWSKWRESGLFTEVIDPKKYEIAPIDSDNVARAFVTEHHYAGSSYPAARFRYGLYRGGELVGVAVYSHPCNDKVLQIFPGERLEGCELGRFVLLDDVEANGETWFLARTFELLRRDGITGVLSFSDPVPRAAANGRLIHKGHVGTIYASHNGIYLGRGTARTLRLLPDGTVPNERSLQKIRKREQGWIGAAEKLMQYGAQGPVWNDAAAWLREWLPRITRRLPHAGNHKYAWGLTRQVRKYLPTSMPYPKAIDSIGAI